jgi:chromosome segregation protein
MMFLKRLELVGFKSFADRTELEFVPGITAVVGPNGSGKSNISDSIRWVLGEQSAKSLRGSKMEDIIFAGSDMRKAVNYGEVSLTLDNMERSLPLDYSEVTVTRRVYRNAESEYYINKQSCRLKDITELFMDTGLGKEAYSIIGQGRIEEILSTKSEDRRGVFEEAAGIVKYKSRKREAERKLNDTEQNLLRISDLVGELEEQFKPLEEQAEKAKLYKQIKEDLKHKEISLYVYQIGQIHSQWEEVKQQVDKLSSEQLKLSADVNSREADIEQRRWESKRIEEELEALQAKLLQVSEETEKKEGYREVLKERAKNQQQNEASFSSALETLNERKRERENQLNGALEQLNEINDRLQILQQELKIEEEKLMGVSAGSTSEKEEQLKADLLELLNRMASARNDLRHLEQTKESHRHRIDRMSAENAKWLEQQQEIELKAEQVEQASIQMKQEIGDVLERYQKQSQQLKDKQQLHNEVQQTLRKCQQKLDALVSRRDTINELQNDFDGYFHGVREILKARDQAAPGIKGIHGAVAEVIKVPQRFEVAVETALGGALQHIIVENESCGRQAIQFLKQRQSGRATFLPLDIIHGRTIAPHDLKKINSYNGFVGLGSELVHFDSKYRNIIESLLGHVVFADALEDANRIAQASGYRYRVVTLDGDVVNPGGSMTGGSQQKKGANLLGRQRQIEQLNEDIVSTEKALTDLNGHFNKLMKEISEFEEMLEKSREYGEQCRIKEQQYGAQAEQIQLQRKNVTDRLALYYQEKKTYETEIEQADRRTETTKQSLVLMESEEKEIHEKIRLIEQSRKDNESAREEMNHNLTELKIKAAKTSQEKESLSAQVERMKEEYSHIGHEFSTTQQKMESLNQDMNSNLYEEESIATELEQLHRSKLECSQSIEFKRAERYQFTKSMETEEQAIRELRQHLRKTEESLHNAEVKVNRFDVELDNLLKKLADDYELSYELAKERYDQPDNVSEVQQQVRQLKQKIALLGDVNVGAIEEFTRLNERLQFLTEQRDDLLQAKATLYKVIREMNEEMSKRFITTFEAIRHHFSSVFAQLFGGGRANLILSDPENVLDTGIDIVAQPPGKKLQNLALLSGGERALTAIALLFAILMVKPVPFCVLDEVEAALDESNVYRFAHYLREFSGNTQFIVVTHRKGTMEGADVLYGVTMEESGVSKLVSVRLEDHEAESA